MLARLKKLGNRGDTIVEVLIVVVVISTVVGTAYAIATRSQKANQQAQEHTQALKLAEGQLESLRSYQGDITDTLFCMDGQTVVAIPDAQNYPAQCRKNPTGGDCSGGSFCYNVGVTKNGDNYMAEVWWDGITGHRDSVKLFYRMPAI